MTTTVTIQDLVALENNIVIEDIITLPIDHYELEQIIEDILFEGAIATYQRLEGHEEVVAYVVGSQDQYELNRDELIRFNLLLHDIEQAVA